MKTSENITIISKEASSTTNILGFLNIMYSITGKLYKNLVEAQEDEPEIYEAVCLARKNYSRLFRIQREDLEDCLVKLCTDIHRKVRNVANTEHSDSELKEILSAIPIQEPMVFLQRTTYFGKNTEYDRFILSVNPGKDVPEVDFSSLLYRSCFSYDQEHKFCASYKDRQNLKDTILYLGKQYVKDFLDRVVTFDGDDWLLRNFDEEDIKKYYNFLFVG